MCNKDNVKDRAFFLHILDVFSTLPSSDGQSEKT